MKSLFARKKKKDGSAAGHHEYRSETVERVPGMTKGPPQLVIGDQKPPVPPFGGVRD